MQTMQKLGGTRTRMVLAPPAKQVASCSRVRAMMPRRTAGLAVRASVGGVAHPNEVSVPALLASGANAPEPIASYRYHAVLLILG